jgi:yecA family protein
MAARHRVPAPPPLLPPDLIQLGLIPFAVDDQTALATWLAAPQWPAGTMDIYRLEGYLTALLVWPIDLRPGAWLPPVWNDSGWRVPLIISAELPYHRFIRLVGGYLHFIEKRLHAPPLLVTVASSGTNCLDARAVGWCTGFRMALALWANGQRWRTPATRRAVEVISRVAGSGIRSIDASSGAITLLRQTVQILAAERTSRGPLGSLLSRAPGTAPARGAERRR